MVGTASLCWLRCSQPVDVGQVAAHPLDELHLLIQEVVFQEATEMRVCVDRAQGVRILFQGQGSFHGLLVLPDSS